MALINSQNPWALAFGIMGNIISLVVYLAPLPTFYRIYKKKSTESFQALPYVVALFSAMLWLYYALLKTNSFLLITINSFGCVIELLYTAFFIAYAPKKARRFTIKLFVLMNVVLFTSILVVTHFLVKGSLRIKVLGWICVVISVAVFAAPLSIVVKVIKTKSVEFMPFPLSFCLTFSATLWFAYGFFQKDICVAIPNVLGFILGMLQMGLYARYRNAEIRVSEEKNKLPDHIKNIVILSTLGTSEVYPEEEEEEEEDNNDDCDVDEDKKIAKNGMEAKQEDHVQQQCDNLV